MKKQIQYGLFASALLFTANTFAQTAPAPAPATPAAAPATEAAPETIEQNGQKYTLVSTINTIEANREFQQNVNIVQAQLTAARELKQRIDIALTTPEKEALQTKFDETAKSLEGNNQLMAKTYGFSLTRNYVVQIVKTRLFTPVTEEEIKKMEEKPSEKKAEITTVDQKDKDGKDIKVKLLYVAAINGIANNDIFRQNVQLVQAQRQRAAQLDAYLKQTTNADEKKKIEEELKKSEETLQKNNDEMVKTYGFSLIRNYVMEIEEARLYTLLTDDDAKKVEEAKSKPAEAPKAPNAKPAGK